MYGGGGGGGAGGMREWASKVTPGCSTSVQMSQVCENLFEIIKDPSYFRPQLFIKSGVTWGKPVLEVH